MERKNSFVKCLLFAVMVGMVVLGRGCGGKGVFTVPDTSVQGDSYEQKILAGFKTAERVSVVVDLDDEPNIEDRERVENNKANMENILSVLSEEDFKLSRKDDSTGSYFSGDINKQGFEKLTKDFRVKTIYPIEANYDWEILRKFRKTEWVKIKADLRGEHNLTINPTDSSEKRIAIMEEMKKNNKATIESVLSTLSDKEFEVTHKFESTNGFAGEINKPGFEKLIINPKVAMIYLRKIQQVGRCESIPLVDDKLYVN